MNFNEPGYERIRNSPEGDVQNRNYNEGIREGTVRYAMIAQIKNPSPELKETIYRHFSLRKAALLAQVGEWARDKKNSERHATVMKGLLKDLEAALATVPDC